MVAVRDKWTDERLDDLNHRVDDGFRRMDERFVQVDERFAHVDARFESLEREMNRRFDEQHRLIWQGFIALAGFQLTALVAVLGFIAART
jgi:hypothetical protein